MGKWPACHQGPNKYPHPGSASPTPWLPGETRQYTGADGRPVVATRRMDGTVVIRSAIAQGMADRLMDLYVFMDVGLEGRERAHSQGQGTGHESPYGILCNFRSKSGHSKLGIEQHIRDIFPGRPTIPLFLTTETSAHPGTFRPE
ncbi:MAG: hypothetical protein R3B47_15655 [Bacteroidia bacterium]